MPPSHETDNSSTSSDSLKNFDPEAEFEEASHETHLPSPSIFALSARQVIARQVMALDAPPSRANPVASAAHHDADALALFFSTQGSIGVRKEVDKRPETKHGKALGRKEARVSEGGILAGERISEHQSTLENTTAKVSDGEIPAGEQISEHEIEASVSGSSASITPPLPDSVPSPIRRDFFYIRNNKNISNDEIRKSTSGTDTAESSAKGNGLLSTAEKTLTSPVAPASNPSSQQATEQTHDQANSETNPPPGPNQILEEIFARTPKPFAPKTTVKPIPERVPPLQDSPSEELEVGPSTYLFPEELQDAPITSAKPAVNKQDLKQVSDGAEHIPNPSMPPPEPAAPNQQLSDNAKPTSKPTSPPPTSPLTPETLKRNLSPQATDTPPAPKKTRTVEQKIQCEHLCAARGKIPSKQCGNSFRPKGAPFCYLHAPLH